MKKRALLAFILVIIILLQACNPKQGFVNKYADTAPESVSMTDERKPCRFEAKVFSLSDDNYTSSNTYIEISNDAYLPPNLLIETVLMHKSMAGITDNLSVSDVIVSFDTCIVNLTGNFSGKQADWIRLESLILLTLESFCGCKNLCLLHEGRPVTCSGLPLGVSGNTYQTPEEYVSNRTDKLKKVQADNVATVDFLYFVPIEGSVFLRPIKYTESILKKTDDTPKRIEKILKSYSSAYTRYYNRINKTAHDSCFEATLTHTGVEQFNYYTINIEPHSGMKYDITSLFGAVALTVLLNINSIDMLDIVSGDTTQSYNLSDYFGLVGTPFEAYYPLRNESTLEKKEIIIPAVSRFDADAVLKWMLADENVIGTLLPSFANSGIGISYLSDNTAVLSVTPTLRSSIINGYILNGKVYDSPETRERLFLYSIVNTLTKLPTVNSVLFTDAESGKPCETLLRVFLGKPLYENPGLNAD